jgi:hypothetical protein
MNRVALTFLVVSSLLGSGHTVYSAFQIQVPSRTALKVTTDPANVWSWHKEIVLPRTSSVIRERVLVDFDGNGRMDTEDPEIRVTVTDMQFVMPAGFQFFGAMTAWLVDSHGRRWALLVADQYTPRTMQPHNLVTPLVVPHRSELFVEIIYDPTAPQSVSVNLVGREIVL